VCYLIVTYSTDPSPTVDSMRFDKIKKFPNKSCCMRGVQIMPNILYFLILCFRCTCDITCATNN